MVRIAAAALLAFALSVYGAADPAGAKNVGNAAGKQFITGQCLSNADCASNCCAQQNGIGVCSGPGAQFQAGKTGCGFVDKNGGAQAGQGNNNNNNAQNGQGASCNGGNNQNNNGQSNNGQSNNGQNNNGQNNNGGNGNEQNGNGTA